MLRIYFQHVIRISISQTQSIPISSWCGFAWQLFTKKRKKALSGALEKIKTGMQICSACHECMHKFVSENYCGSKWCILFSFAVIVKLRCCSYFRVSSNPIFSSIRRVDDSRLHLFTADFRNEVHSSNLHTRERGRYHVTVPPQKKRWQRRGTAKTFMGSCNFKFES